MLKKTNLPHPHQKIANIIFSTAALKREKWQIFYSASICNLEQERQSLRVEASELK